MKQQYYPVRLWESPEELEQKEETTSLERRYLQDWKNGLIYWEADKQTLFGTEFMLWQKQQGRVIQ